MQPQVDRQLGRERATYTVQVERIDDAAWHLTVRELPETWTVAFGRDELEPRARERIALDLDCHPSDFDLRIIEVRGPD
jgi:hypothetical protein